uniref:Uncharacterized protein n=1 Tax=Maylandia zebra TaxID=106582 RepID=A0A3P9BRS5_9CICH
MCALIKSGFVSLGLLKFDLDMGGSKTQTISLVQGQRPIAARMIDKAIKEGTWVVLQNCHRQILHFFLLIYCINNIKKQNYTFISQSISCRMVIPISDPDFFGGSKKQVIWQKLLFGLTFFHVPLEALTYLTGESQHSSLLSSLPISADPCVFRLNSNAEITKDNQETNQLLEGVLLTLCRQLGGGYHPTELVDELAEDILSKLPTDFGMQMVMDKYPVKYEEIMNAVLRQEVIRFNRLTDVVCVTLVKIRKALKGQIAMSTELKSIFNSMLVGKVPAMWAAKSYTSFNHMRSYMTDLLAMQATVSTNNGQPTRLVALQLQNFARKYNIPIDYTSFEFESQMDEKPEDGAYIKGLFMEGSLPKILVDSLPKHKPGEMDNARRETYTHFIFTNSNTITLDQVAAEWCSLAVFMSALLDVPCGQHL